MTSRRNVSHSMSLSSMSDEALQQQQDDGLLHSNKRPSWFIIQVTAIASLGGILFGYDLGVITGALPQLKVAFDLSSREQEIVVSILYVGGFFGAAFGGSLCDAFGRKRAILITDVLFLVGALMLYAAPGYAMVVAGRIVVGFAIAVSGIADVTYLHEIAPVQFRGSIVSVNEACISLGFLFSFAVGGLLSYEGSDSGWRTMFGVSGLLAVAQFVGMWNMPESPLWLNERGLTQESEIAMKQINSSHSLRSISSSSIVEDEQSPARRKQQTTEYESVSSADPNNNGRPAMDSPSQFDLSLPNSPNAGIVGKLMLYWRQVVFLCLELKTFAVQTVQNYRRQAYITLFLSVTQQCCGQISVLNYAPLIFAGVAGNDDESSSSYVRGWATLSIGLVKFLVTVVVIWKVESLGRRFLLLLGMSTIALGLFLLAVAFGNTQDESQTAGGFVLALPGVLLVVSGYSMSFGPLTWLLTSELFPTEIRGRALGFETIITNLCAVLVTVTFLTAQEAVGPSAVFAVYMLITLLGLVFASLAIPDTGKKSVEEINEDLNEMMWWRMWRRIPSSDSSPLVRVEREMT